MVMFKQVFACLGYLCLWSSGASAETPVNPPDSLSAARIVAMARDRAPEVLLAQTRVLEARGRLAGARVWLQENPVIEGVANVDRRFERRTELELTVPIELGFHRSRRVGAARAEVQREEYLATDAGRRAIGVALTAYYRVLHAEQRLALARERQTLADELQRTAAEKVRAGDAARIDLNVAEIELSRAESEALSEEHQVARARVELAGVLGLPSVAGLLVAGELADQSFLGSALADTNAIERPDVLAAESEVEAAASEAALARTALLPDLFLRWNYGHEDGEAIERRGLALSVPLFNHGQGERGLARARRERARVELGSRRAQASAEVEGARASYLAALSAVHQLEIRGIPRALETETMAQDSYRAGKMDLLGVLVVRREALETRREYLDRLLEAALSAIDVAVATSAFR